MNRWTLITLTWLVALALSVTVYGMINAQRSQESGPVNFQELPGKTVFVVQDVRHIAHATVKHTPYTSVPATSGPHVGWPISEGVHTKVIPDEVAVHALEHGHIGLRYGPNVAASERNQLIAFVQKNPRGVFLAPDPRLANKIAATAWGKLLVTERYNEARLEEFISKLKGLYDHGWTREVVDLPN